MGSASGRHVNGATMLKAAELGQLTKVQKCLDRGVNANCNDMSMWTPLHFASKYDYADVVKMLLERGADVDAGDDRQWTPLHLASQNGNADIVKMLLERGADVDATEDKQWAPLHFASYHGKADVVTMLIERGANINPIEKDGWTPLHMASQTADHVNVVKILLEKGANVNGSGNNGWTPLHLASKQGCVDVAEKLLAAGADVFATAVDGKTPRDLAAAEKHTTVVQALDKSAQDHPVTYLCAGDHALAEKRAARVIAALKLEKSAFAWIGESLLRQRKHEEARVAFLVGLETNPSDVDCALGLANAPPPPAQDAETTTPTFVPQGECVICMDKPRCAVCVPCGHLAGCYDCLLVVQKKGGCPICRRAIATVVRVYTC